MFAVDLPTLALAAWARPAPHAGSLLRPVFRFALPAACALTLVGFVVYVGYFIVGMHAIPEGGPERVVAALAVQSVTQTALTIVSVVCGLLLLVFVEPPTVAWTGGDVLSGDRRPTLAVLLVAFAAILAVPPPRESFELAALAPTDYAVLGLATGVWALLVRRVWRAHLLDRLLSRS